MRAGGMSLGTIVWVVIGVVVASNHNFLHNLNHLSPILSAVLAVLLWPLVLLKVHFGI